jgi:hypothetical protein
MRTLQVLVIESMRRDQLIGTSFASNLVWE